MSNTPTHLDFPFDAHNVRVVVVNDKPLFVLSDIAGLLGYRDADKAARMLDPDEKGTHKVGTLGGPQDVLVCNEPGLYRLLFRSERFEAKSFTRHVTHVILPTIRRTGGYSARTARALPLDRASRASTLLLDKIRSETDAEVRRALYAQLQACLDPLGLPYPPLEQLGADAAPLPDAVAEFWEVVIALLAAGEQLNHTHQSGRLALNLPEVRAAAQRHGARLPDQAALRALRRSQRPAFVRVCVVNSARTRKSTYCWVFGEISPPADEPPAQAQLELVDVAKTGEAQ